MAVVAIDWSGARRPARKLWLAEAHGGQLRRVVGLQSREAAAEEVIRFCEHTPNAIVGLDFAFSMPAWFLKESQASTAFEFWELVEAKGEDWLRKCSSPFWGRPGKCKPPLLECYRSTEKEVRAVQGIKPKSCFQIGGAGAVGTGSIRGMPMLRCLRKAGISIWPFDPPTLPIVVEIYPRLLTGPVKKSSAEARGDYLAQKGYDLPSALRANIVRSEDAFDAAVSALMLDRHRAQLERLPSPLDETHRLEGAIWAPDLNGLCPT